MPNPLASSLARRSLQTGVVTSAHAAGAATKVFPRFPRFSIRIHAFVLILVVAVPLGALLLGAVRQIARQDEVNAAVMARQVALIAASEDDLLLSDARGMLERLAQRPAIRRADPASCDTVFADFGERLAPLLSLRLVDAAGQPLCSTAAAPPGANSYRDRQWFEGIAQGAPFVVGAPHRATGSGRWTVMVSIPVRDPDGRLAGVLATALDLAGMSAPASRGADLPGGSTIDLIDDRGRLLARSGGPGEVGHRIRGEAIGRVLGQRSGAIRGASYDGPDREVGFARLDAVPWTAIVSIPSAAALANARHLEHVNLLLVAALIALMLAATAIIARRMLRPIRTVAAVADAVARGDLSARASVGGPREVAHIAAEINRMLDQRQRDELTLRDSEARFRQLIETSSDAILIVDREGRIVFANGAIERVLGHKPVALAGSELAMLQPERFRDIHRRAMRRFLATGTTGLHWRAKEFTGLHADGREVPLEVAVSYPRTGSTDVFAAFLRDISARKRAEAELRESEARFRLLADSAPTLIWMADAGGDCVYVNRRWTEFTAQTPAQVCGDGWTAAVHPDDRQPVLARKAEALALHQAFSIEYRLRRHDGEYRWMLDSGAPRLAGDGALLGYIGSCIDIHERIGAERRIRRLSTLYSALSRANEAMARTRGTAALLQQVCDIAVVHGGFHVVSIGLVDEQARCLQTVAVAGETHDYFDRLVLPLAVDESCHDAPSLIAFREDRPYISNDRGRDPRAIPIRNPAARSAIRSTAALPLRREGRVSGYLTVHSSEVDYFDAEMVELLQLLAADLSFALDTMAADRRREQAESELRKLNATLEQKVEERTRSLQAANRELEAFSYSMSHDLRAPLRAINGFTELIAEGHLESLNHEARGYLERIRAASQRMARLIDDLMNLCRIAQMELVREPLDLSRLAAEVIAELQEGEPQRAVQVRIAPGIVVEADRGLTQIALANLLGNAWKFTSRRERPAIAFGVTQHEGRSCYFVRDNGAGFDMSHADKLFAPFQRLHAEHEFAGTGIGLSLVQRIVQRHGGVVSAQSTEGEGTSVYFTLNP